jgi:hypothetical protein
MATLGLLLAPTLALQQPIREGHGAHQLLPTHAPSAAPSRHAHAPAASARADSAASVRVDPVSSPQWLRGFAPASLEAKLSAASAAESAFVAYQSVAAPTPPPNAPVLPPMSAIVGRLVLLVSLSMGVCCLIVVCFLSMGTFFSESTARKLLALADNGNNNDSPTDKTTKPPDAPKAPHKSFFFPDGSHNSSWLIGGEQPSGPDETSDAPNEAGAPASAAAGGSGSGGGSSGSVLGGLVFADTEAPPPVPVAPASRAEMAVWHSVASATYPPHSLPTAVASPVASASQAGAPPLSSAAILADVEWQSSETPSRWPASAGAGASTAHAMQRSGSWSHSAFSEEYERGTHGGAAVAVKGGGNGGGDAASGSVGAPGAVAPSPPPSSPGSAAASSSDASDGSDGLAPRPPRTVRSRPLLPQRASSFPRLEPPPPDADDALQQPPRPPTPPATVDGAGDGSTVAAALRRVSWRLPLFGSQ